MPLLNLDEIDALSRSVRGFSTKKWALASFWSQDFINGEANTKLAAQKKLQELTGELLTGKVLVLCQLRYMGLYFSPVNFYYLFDEKDNWRYLLAEVSNTPWNERHYYAIPNEKNWQHAKAFHVSPFNPLTQQYIWRVKPIANKVFVHLSVAGVEVEFDATLALKKQPFSSKVLAKLLMKTPVMTIKIIFLIYWQALKLWLKGANFYSHPKHSKE